MTTELNDTQLILLTARTLIADRACWTQEAYARDASGEQVDWSDPSAVCWCSVGAIELCSYGQPTGSRFAAYDFLNPKVIVWNDSPNRTHADVIAAFDRAIERAA